MPVFHTTTIESILEPVAQQVSRLVILHEDAEDGSAMPDLSRPIQAVSQAVTNLVIIGQETITKCDDQILKQDMPPSLVRVETSSQLLEEASQMLRADPYSGPARKKLIEGSRGILQGTSSLLLCFDESEVRRIIRGCKMVLDYLALTEIIRSMEELRQFLKDFSGTLAEVSREVAARQRELTHKEHSDMLVECLNQIKILVPILICSMKVYIHVIEKGGNGATEAAENRNYLASRLGDEIQEIIRVLQLTTYEEDTTDLDNFAILKKINDAIHNGVEKPLDWLTNPYAPPGSRDEKTLRQIVDYAHKVADRCLPQDAQQIRKLAGNISNMMNTLCEMRLDNKGGTPQAEALARDIRDKFGHLEQAILSGVMGVDKSGLYATHTVQGRIEQACRWLQNPDVDDKGLGQQAIALIVDEGKRIADGCPAHQKLELLQLCNEIESLSNQFAKLCSAGLGSSPEGHEVARRLNSRLNKLKDMIQNLLTNRVVQDFMDVTTPLKQFVDAVNAPENTPGRDAHFHQTTNNLKGFSGNAVKTGQLVATFGTGGDKKLAEALLSSASKIDSFTPHLISAGHIRLNYPQSMAADEHLNDLKQEFANTVLRLRSLCDQIIDPSEFIKTTEDLMQKYSFLCEEGIAQRSPQKMVDNTSNIARLVNRVILLARQEADNSEDPDYINHVLLASMKLDTSLQEMVNAAKEVAPDITNPAAASNWRERNKTLLAAVRGVRDAIVHDPKASMAMPNMSSLHIDPDNAPPRPPLPREGMPPTRPPPPETDDEDEVFKQAPHANQPILIAAHGLHQEVRQWSSKDNEIIAAAKRMAVLMARLSELVRTDSKGSKRQLITTAKEIAEASEDVTRLAKQLARECTDKRIRTNLLQVCERIPTIGTQLKILSTVKATMLGAQGTDEDREATEMLVGNAQNLMQSVKETVRAAEGASIKIRSAQTNHRLRWVRRQPWYQY